MFSAVRWYICSFCHRWMLLTGKERVSASPARQMCTQSIFENVFYIKIHFSDFPSCADFTSILLFLFAWREGGEKIINKNFYPSRFFFSFLFFGNVKMRLTFMVVFFTIYNAQSQRKRKFSCINQRPWKREEKKYLNWYSCEMYLMCSSYMNLAHIDIASGRRERINEL